MSDGKPISAENIGKVLITGDLSVLTEEQRLAYYHRVCESLSLNPLTQPFQYVRLSGGLKLYATRAASEQLAASRGVSIDFVSEDLRNGVYIFRVVAATADGGSGAGAGARAGDGCRARRGPQGRSAVQRDNEGRDQELPAGDAAGLRPGCPR